MSGMCNGCATKFSFFKKEKGCKNCGYSFCKDCLPHKVPVPRLKNEKHEVCKKCYDLLTGKTKPAQPAKYSPPENFKKRVAALSDPNAVKPLRSDVRVKGPSAGGSGAGGGGVRNMDKYKGMAKEDQAIAERLEKLKEARAAAAGPVPSQAEIENRLKDLKGDQPPAPSEQEMAARLVQLKGQDPSAVNRKHVFPVDRRSEQQQIDDLLQEIHDEVEIDSHGTDLAQDVADRLAHLKGKEPDKPAGTSGMSDEELRAMAAGSGPADKKTGDEDDDVAEIQKMIQQAANELQLDAEKTIADLQKDKEIWDKLQKLKGGKSKKEMKEMMEENTEDEDDDEETEDQVAQRLIKQLIEEQRLDDEAAEDEIGMTRTKKTSEPKNAPKDEEELPEDPDELPYCCICNDDASLRCPGCEGDLYCRRCFKEGHDKLDMNDHKPVKYKMPKGYTD